MLYFFVATCGFALGLTLGIVTARRRVRATDSGWHLHSGADFQNRASRHWVDLGAITEKVSTAGVAGALIDYTRRP